MRRFLPLTLFLICCVAGSVLHGAQSKPMRELTYDASAAVLDLLGKETAGKLRIRVIPQNEFLSRILIENLTNEPLTVRLPKAVAAVHRVPREETLRTTRTPADEDAEQETELEGTGQAVVGTFGPMNDAAAFPHQSDEGDAFTIPAGRAVQIQMHSVCAEHGKRSPISRMTYALTALDQQIPNATLQAVIKSYDPKKTDPLAFQAAVWHLANGLSWNELSQKTVKRGGQVVPYFTRLQLHSAQQLIEDAKP